jgi:hypothetical protein
MVNRSEDDSIRIHPPNQDVDIYCGPRQGPLSIFHVLVEELGSDYFVDLLTDFIRQTCRRHWRFSCIWSGCCLRRIWCFIWWSYNFVFWFNSQLSCVFRIFNPGKHCLSFYWIERLATLAYYFCTGESFAVETNLRASGYAFVFVGFHFLSFFFFNEMLTIFW